VHRLRPRPSRQGPGHFISRLSIPCTPPAPTPRALVAASVAALRPHAPTTDLLTAASTDDTRGVGITAAAGTKLALHSPSTTVLSWPLAHTPPDCLPGGVGNFRACCRPWTWQPSLRLPLRIQTRVSRHPSPPWLSFTRPTSCWVRGSSCSLAPVSSGYRPRRPDSPALLSRSSLPCVRRHAWLSLRG